MTVVAEKIKRSDIAVIESFYRVAVIFKQASERLEVDVLVKLNDIPEFIVMKNKIVGQIFD